MAKSKSKSDGVESGNASFDAPNSEQNVIPVIEESVSVSTIAVDKGGYRIAKTVETREELVDELLRNQRVEIERRSINIPIADDVIPQIRHEGDTLVIPVVKEILITVKRLILVEEVRITHVEDTHRSPQKVLLRKEEIVVERLDADESASEKSP